MMAWSLLLIIVVFSLHWLSYRHLKCNVLKSRKWGLNICCGKTDGGGVNADIVQHIDLPNFLLLKDIYSLPFKDKEFDSVLCSHTIEHVDNPKLFYKELRRVGKEVTLVVPPIWDIYAALNFFFHKWIVVSFKKVHQELPLMIPYPLGFLYDKLFGQIVCNPLAWMKRKKK